MGALSDVAVVLRMRQSIYIAHQTTVPVSFYTLSHPENDRDDPERVKGYTLQDASFMRQSQDSVLMCEKTHMLRVR